MKDESCPCMTDKARKIKRMTVGETSVGIAQLDQIMEEVNSMGLERNKIGMELLRRVKIFNYVPSGASSEYEKALIEEYERRYEN
ncbi:MAG TPA: hypothetical protein VMW26_03800 [Methanomassiliicoccales archaeon]|nr:hypothetical protein [Methanomassiliicoccales archaeon]